jgi:hypothetical protein
MMGVYIKGMEMPKEGSWVTLRVFPDGKCFLYSWCGNDFDFMEHLTAVHVPPHGRLGDLDKLEKMFADIDSAPYSCFDGAEPFYSAEDAAHIIKLAPTIIPPKEERV